MILLFDNKEHIGYNILVITVNIIFESNRISKKIYFNMLGKSIPLEFKNEIDIYNLSFLKVTHLGFDNKEHIGELIVDKNLSEEILDIFKELFEIKYKIEKIKLIDEYDGDDEKSMCDNNSSAFCFRKIANTNKLSSHALGRAIDINPLYNPYVFKDKILPKNAFPYLDRNKNDFRYIKEGDSIYSIFIKKGWKWSSKYEDRVDYQHFYKL